MDLVHTLNIAILHDDDHNDDDDIIHFFDHVQFIHINVDIHRNIHNTGNG